MATRTNRTNPVRNTNNKTAAAVRTALKQVARRADTIEKSLDKVWDENETICQTIDALQQKIYDGDITSSAVIDALTKIQDRILASNERLNREQMNLTTLSNDAEWIADENR